ncbi:hypothetical protein RchiOBHm_Chr1g0314041 [Rosa chinensis]|uniref:Uncharacterized protein n=1 Tax=Rosa chinensis TaxID=74649 RepID=A0A2P6S715_ROSCH|nr:hypothetical protein RchiOBHm_Chr1g0314041 [Rosa chinensis]
MESMPTTVANVKAEQSGRLSMLKQIQREFLPPARKGKLNCRRRNVESRSISHCRHEESSEIPRK